MSIEFERIQHLLIDLDGVLYRGNAPLPEAREFVAWIRQRGLEFRLVTNNATLTQAQYVEKLSRMRIDVDESEIFTSALATGLYLKEQMTPGQSAFVLGEEGLREAVTGAGLTLGKDHADWVVVGLDRRLTYENLAVAALAIQNGGRFVGSNPDTSFPNEQGLIPGAGAIQAALVACTGVEPTVVGKPRPLMLRLAMDSLSGVPGDTVMIGDRLDTDIAGANALSMPAVLVLTGVSSRRDLERAPERADVVVDSLSSLMGLWNA